MARLIDADAKITALLYDEEHEETKRTEMTIADFLDSHTEEGCPQSGGWISVKDRPPEKDQTVIIYGSWVGVSGTVYEETQFISMDEAIYKGFTPIAWMPMPEPPKEESDGKCK